MFLTPIRHPFYTHSSSFSSLYIRTAPSCSVLLSLTLPPFKLSPLLQFLIHHLPTSTPFSGSSPSSSHPSPQVRTTLLSPPVSLHPVLLLLPPLLLLRYFGRHPGTGRAVGAARDSSIHMSLTSPASTAQRGSWRLVRHVNTARALPRQA